MGRAARRLVGALAAVVLLTTQLPPSSARAVEATTFAFQGDAAHSGVVNMALELPLSREWRIDLDGGVQQPVVADGRVFALAGDQVVALELRTGTLLWGPFDINGDPDRRPNAVLSYANGRVFVAGGGGITAYDAVTGATSWSVAGQSMNPVPADGLVYFGRDEQHVAARQSDGALVWESSAQNERGVNLYGGQAVAEGQVYGNRDCASPHRVDPATDTAVWSHETGQFGGGGVPPAVVHGRVFARSWCSPSGAVGLILDAETGAELGTFPPAHAPAATATHVYAVDQGNLVAQELDGGDRAWSFDAAADVATNVLGVGRYLLVATSEGTLHAVSRDTGASVWHDELGAGIDGGQIHEVGVGVAAGEGYVLAPAGTHLTAYRGAGRPEANSVTVPPRATVTSSAVTYDGPSALHGGDLHRTRATTAGSLSVPLEHGWSRDFPGWVGTPLVAEGIAFVPVDREGELAATLYAVDLATGGDAWPAVTYDLDWLQYLGLAYDGGKLFVLDNNGGIHAYVAATGEPMWATQLPDSPDGFYIADLFDTAPTAAHGLVYVIGQRRGGVLWAVDQATGDRVWWQGLMSAGQGAAPAVSNDSVVVGFSCDVHSFDALTGATKWYFDGGCSGRGGSAAVVGDRVYAGEDGAVTSHEAATGRMVGRFNTQNDPAFHDTTAWVTLLGRLRAVDLPTNTIVWSRRDDRLVTDPLLVGDAVFVGGSDGVLRAFDRGTGQLSWSEAVGTSFTRPWPWPKEMPTSLVAADGYLIAPTGHQIHAFQAAAAGAQPTPSPRPDDPPPDAGDGGGGQPVQPTPGPTDSPGSTPAATPAPAPSPTSSPGTTSPSSPDAHRVVACPTPASQPFDDLTGNVHADAVACGVHHGLVQGTTATRYDPASRVTRAQLGSFFARLLRRAGLALPEIEAPRFDDVGGPHAPAIEQLAALGVVQGRGDRRYAPAKAVTRAQMATYIIRVAELVSTVTERPGTDRFDDDDGSVHERNINRAAAAGLAVGVSRDRYAPSRPVRRDQLASFLQRVLDRMARQGRLAG